MPLLSACILTIFLTLSSLLVPANARADDPGPQTENITISAAIIDHFGPTTPILISPENNSYVTTGYVIFVWKKSTDESGIKEYELLIDGSVLITDIPPNDAETSRFILDYDEATEYYTLRVKELIADDTHTWKIIAIDTLENGTDSATWSFTVDTQAPNFILSQVGEVPTTISAQDISTVPENPIELEENQPKLLGNGEANSTVVLTVTIPGDPTQTFTNTTDINGNWGQQLGILPRDIIMTLDFTITDQAGLISVLNDVQFIIKTKIFIFPPTSPSPSPSPTITPTPGVTPPPTPPTSPAPTPLIAIPFTPPIEIAYEILQETWEHLPAPLKAIVARIPIGTRQYLVATAINLFPISALLLLALIGLLALLAMINRFGKDLSPRLIWRTLQALRLLPAGKPQGLVYDSQTHRGIPFALVEVRNKDGEIIDLVVTDKNGIYRGLILEPGKYQLMVSHPDYDFPTSQVRPAYLTNREFYQSEIFEVLTKHAAKNQMLYLIPVDLLTKKPQNQFKIDLSLESFSRLNAVLFFPLFLVTGSLTMIFPTVWNWLVFGSYCIQITFKASYWFKTLGLTGNTIDTNGQSLENTIVAVVDTEAHQFAALTQAENDGSFSAYLPKQQLLLAITKPGFFWVENNEPVTEYILDTTLEPKHVIVTLKKA
jgi:carboxypeptidase family protein